MRKIIFLFLIIPYLTFSQTTDWVKSFGGINSDKGISIGTDSLGFIYVSGFYNSEATFDAITLSNGSPGTNKEAFLMKLDSLGNVLWVIAGGNQSGGCCDDRALGMHVTPGGYVYLTGTYWSSFYIGTCSISGSNAHDGSLLTKIDPNGNCIWARTFGADNTSGGCSWPIYDADDHSYDVKVDDDKFIYVTGFFSGYDADFDAITLSNPDWNNTCTPLGYIVKFDDNGDVIWADKFDGVKDQRGSRDNRLAIDQFSNIYVTGGFENTGNYGPFSITSNGEWDAFLFKMNKDGDWLWAKNIGSNKTDRANSIAVDICGDVYITGEYRNPMVFPGANASNGTDTLSHKQKRDVFVAKCNSNGDWQWAKRARSRKTDKAYQMSVDENKQVFICGSTGDTTTFSNSITVNSPNLNDTSLSAFVSQIDGTTNSADWLWAKKAGTPTDDDRTNDICPDGFGNVYAVGFFEDVANFDGINLTSLGKKDIFVWKMSMIPGSFTVNNFFDTIYIDSMVFNTADTGIFVKKTYYVNGCDTLFTDSVVHQKLGIQIIYDINNVGSATVTIDGVIQALPYSQNYWYGENITLLAQLSPNWLFNQWQSNTNPILPNANSMLANFDAISSDSVILITYPKPPLTAFISGNDSICENSANNAEVKIYFSAAVSPFTFVYEKDGIQQPSINTTLNPYIISTREEGVYTLLSFSDANEVGWPSGSALVTVIQPPTALFNLESDTLSIIYPNANFNDFSIQGDGTISDWLWNFGDNTFEEIIQNPTHRFKDSSGIFEVSLIIQDDFGCTDTTYNHIWITDEYWMYIPNSFTPDNDQINDLFCISFNGIRTETFLFNVYNRTSDVVFSTTNINEIECFLNSNGWDGKHQDTGIDLPLGMYIYEIYFQDFEGWKHQDFGYIYIIR